MSGTNYSEAGGSLSVFITSVSDSQRQVTGKNTAVVKPHVYKGAHKYMKNNRNR